MTNAQRRHRLSTHPSISQDQKDRDVARALPLLGGVHQRIHHVRPGLLHGRLTMMGWSIEQRDRIRGDQLPLRQKRAKARHSVLAYADRAHSEIAGGHVIHPALDCRGLDVAELGQSSMIPTWSAETWPKYCLSSFASRRDPYCA